MQFDCTCCCRVLIPYLTRRLQVLKAMLPEIRALLRMPKLDYFSVSGIDFLIELPTDTKVPKEWVIVNR